MSYAAGRLSSSEGLSLLKFSRLGPVELVGEVRVNMKRQVGRPSDTSTVEPVSPEANSREMRVTDRRSRRHTPGAASLANRTKR